MSRATFESQILVLRVNSPNISRPLVCKFYRIPSAIYMFHLTHNLNVIFSGTHGYMAPEVIKKGVQYTFTADWFSLGCVLYKLLKG